MLAHTRYKADKFGNSPTKQHAQAANFFLLAHALFGTMGGSSKPYVSPEQKRKKKLEKKARKEHYRRSKR